MSTVAPMPGTLFVVVLKSVRLETEPDDLVPTERLAFERLGSARSMAARMLLTAREKGWEVFPMEMTDPYAWCVIAPGIVHFITIEATGKNDYESTD